MYLMLLSLFSTDTLPRRTIQVAAGELISTVSVGEGPAIVMLNGLIGGAFGFRHLIAEVANLGFRAVAVEPLGLGESSRPRHADYSLTAQVERIAEVLDSLGVRKAIVLAHSLGGSLALRLACRRPDLVRGILSIDGGPAESAATPGLKRAMRWAPLLKLFVGRGTIRREVRKELLKNSSDSTWLTPEVLDGYTEPPGRDIGATIDALKGMARSQEPQSLRDRLSQIVIPVRLLIGTWPHESAVLDEETALMRRLIPDFALDSVPGSGQLVHEERPRVVVSALLALDHQTSTTPVTVGVPPTN
jgi:pimeloyl-ACP methyl ester carboxylesterase